MTQTKSVPKNDCECGCGTKVNKRFVPGHHFRLLDKTQIKKKQAEKFRCARCDRVLPRDEDDQLAKSVIRSTFQKRTYYCGPYEWGECNDIAALRRETATPPPVKEEIEAPKKRKLPRRKLG